MNESLNDFTVEQQAQLLAIAAHLLGLWCQMGKTDVPEGFGTLHNFAMFTAISAVDFYEGIEDV